MADKLNIKLNIAGKSYPLNIDGENEEKYRRAEREVNAWVDRYRKHLRGEREDYLALAALALAMSNIETQMSRSLGDDLDALTELDGELDGYLNSLK